MTPKQVETLLSYGLDGIAIINQDGGVSVELTVHDLCETLDGLSAEKYNLIAKISSLETTIGNLQALNELLAERTAAQSEILSRNARKTCDVLIDGDRCVLPVGHEGGHKWGSGD